jgi:AraC family transcriptional regulator
MGGALDFRRMSRARIGRTQPGSSRAPVLSAGRFYGVVDHRWRTELVTLTLLRHAEAGRVPAHSHEHIFLSLLLHGGYREWVGERELAYRPLNVVFHPEHLEHFDEIRTPGTTFFTVECSPALLGARDRRHRELQSVRELGGGPVVWSMLRLLDALRRQHRDPLECEESIGDILDDLIGRPEASASRPRWLSRVEELLRTRYQEQVSLHELATLAGVHPVHVSRVFRRHHGGSIRDFVHRLRVVHACRLIGERESLASAAVDSGFCDQSHMTRVFLAITGMTPSTFRTTAVG